MSTIGPNPLRLVFERIDRSFRKGILTIWMACAGVALSSRERVFDDRCPMNLVD
jgi:hypothetical protein